MRRYGSIFKDEGDFICGLVLEVVADKTASLDCDGCFVLSDL